MHVISTFQSLERLSLALTLPLTLPLSLPESLALPRLRPHRSPQSTRQTPIRQHIRNTKYDQLPSPGTVSRSEVTTRWRAMLRSPYFYASSVWPSVWLMRLISSASSRLKKDIHPSIISCSSRNHPNNVITCEQHQFILDNG